MKTTIDYTNSPAKNFDAVEDVKDWLGARYDALASEMRNVRNPKYFTFYCSLAGIEGFPVQAWYDHFHGEGKYLAMWDLLETATCERNAMRESI